MSGNWEDEIRAREEEARVPFHTVTDPPDGDCSSGCRQNASPGPRTRR